MDRRKSMATTVGVVTASHELYALVQDVLERDGWRAEWVEQISRESLRFDAILWEVGELEGDEANRLSGLLPALAPIPVIGFSRAMVPDRVLVRCLELGMHDFVEAGLSRDRVLRARLQAAVQAMALREPATARRGSVVVLSQKDPITGLCSREHFLKTYEALVRPCETDSQHISVASIHFKDTLVLEAMYGPAGVNTFLRLTARAFLAVARQSDAIGRIGPDRFSIIFPKCTSSIALTALERLTDSLERTEYPFKLPGGDKPSLNIGVAGTDRGIRGSDLLRSSVEMVSRTLQPEQPRILVHTGTTVGIQATRG